MAPLRPQPSRASSRSSAYVDATDDRHAEQAGRSTANLNAAASAQSLRESSRSSSRAPSKSSSQPNLLRKQSRPDTSTLPTLSVTQPMPQPPPESAAGVSGQPSPHNLDSTSPLDSTPTNASSDSSGSRKNSDDTGSGSQPSAARSKASLVPPGTAGSGASRHPYGQRPPMIGGESTLSLPGQQTPRSIRELGSDYNRYYNPFASNNNSVQDLATPLTRYNSSSHLMAGNAMSSTDLNKRLSDPFNDQKRMSNPFESAQSTRPGTPNRQDSETGGTSFPVGSAVAGGAAGAGYFTEKGGVPVNVNEVDPEKAEFFPYMDDRLGAPEYDFPLFTDAVEDDDDLHMPHWDDDIKLKASWREHFTKENIVSTFGMIFMTLGLLLIFVVLPVVSFTGSSLIKYSYETPLDQMPGYGNKPLDRDSWAFVNDRKYPIFQNMRKGLIDPDTPNDATYRTDTNGKRMKLVFSDEFNEDNRTFYPGDDPYWYAPDIWYGATMDLEWYDPDAANTGDGVLQLQLDEFRNHNMDFRSGMLHSWNQLCFKGGVFEISASLPGPGGIHGLWPGAWTMGNLGRPGYLATTDGVWPYTYDDCDAGITPNQSHTDGLSKLPGQKLNKCTCEADEHPTPGRGRGAPEIDIIEVSADWGGMNVAVATQSYQVAPFDIWWYPNVDFMETPDYSLSFVNTYTGGPFQQAVSTTTMLNNTWYDGIEYQKYAFEYAPGDDEDAYIAWYVGEDEMMKFDARAVGPNGNVGQRLISEEPMSIIINLGISENWVNIVWDKLHFPTVYRIDYVRLYQLEGEEMITCDPPGYETTDYIEKHPKAYQNPNYTLWEDTGYNWPTNSLVHGCDA